VIKMTAQASLLGLFLLAASSASIAEEVQKSPLRVEASPVANPASLEASEMEFRVTNLGTSSIQMHETDLPWGLRVKTLIVGTGRQSWKSARSAGFVVEDPYKLVRKEIAPGELVVGRIRLVDHLEFQDLKSRTEDLIVFWHFAAKSTDGADLGEYGGWMAVRNNKNAPRRIP